MNFFGYGKLIDSALEELLPQPSGLAAKLYEAMRYALLSPGKRIRPSVFLYCTKLFGTDTAFAMPFACAIEMIHAYSLIHDDLPCMDDDELRRGRPTCHVVFGEAMALLAGDALLSHAFETMLTAAKNADPSKKAQCIDAMECIAACAGAGGMVAGQSADMYNTGSEEDGLWYIYNNKTARMFIACAKGGALLAGAGEAKSGALERYALHLGRAFQITDDILDETGNAATLGKNTGSDRAQEKLTSVSLFGLEGARVRAKAEVDAAKAALLDIKGVGEPGSPLYELACWLLRREK